MAFTTPTDDLNSPQASSNGSEGLYKEHEGNVLTTMHDEQALEHLLENLPDEKVLSYIFIHLHRRQAAIRPFLDCQPSARSQLVALGKLAVVDAPPSPAATPISIDQTPQAASPSIPERRLQDEYEENGRMCICRETGDGAVQHPTNTALDVAQEVHAKEPPQTREDASSPPSPNADSQPSAKSHPPRGQKRMADTSTPKRKPKRPKKRSRADQVDRAQEELLAKVIQLMDDSVTVHDIIFVLEQFGLQRDSIAIRGDHADHTDQDEPQQQDPDRRPGLKKWWDGLDVHEKGERWEKCLQRVFAGLFYGQYNDEKQAFDERKKTGKLPHPSEMYVDVCFPETIILDGELLSEQAITARAEAKRRFQNEVQKKKMWAMMQKRYGIAVFLLLNPTLQEDHVRRLRESNLELLLDRIDERHPSLKEDLQGLSGHLSYYIDKGRFPTRKLRFEELSRSELESECFKSLSLSDMFKPLESPAATIPVLHRQRLSASWTGSIEYSL